MEILPRLRSERHFAEGFGWLGVEMLEQKPGMLAEVLQELRRRLTRRFEASGVGLGASRKIEQSSSCRPYLKGTVLRRGRIARLTLASSAGFFGGA